MAKRTKQRRQDLIRDAATMFARGSSMDAISGKLSVPVGTLRYWREKKSDEWNAAVERAESLVGKVPHRKHTRPSPETIAAAAEMQADGKTQAEIAERFGVTPDVVAVWRANHRDHWDAAYLAKQQPFDAPPKPPPPRPSDPTKPARALWAICLAMFERKASIRSGLTRNHYRYSLNSFAEFLGRVPTEADLDDDVLCAWLAKLMQKTSGEKPISICTARSYVERVRAIWRFANDRGEIFTRPTFTLPQVPDPTPIALDEQQLRRLFESAMCRPGLICGVPARYWWPALFGFVFCTSERRGATLAMRWEWVNLAAKTASIPHNVRKGGMKSATYSLWDEVAWLLNRIAEPRRERVFQWELSEGTFYHHYGKILVDAQLPDDRKHKLHSLRVSHNTWTKAMTGNHSPLLMHSSTATSERHYEDRRFTVKPPPKPFVPWHSNDAMAFIG